jgi:GT2 family glycosyltransferase
MIDDIRQAAHDPEHVMTPEEILATGGMFDENAYVRAYPDVAQAITEGSIVSADEHYLIHGRAEGRRRPAIRVDGPSHALRFPRAALAAPPPREFRCSLEGVLLSSGGGAVALGWLDDVADELEGIQLSGPDWVIRLHAASVMRTRRPDVESAIGHTTPHAYGFIGAYFEAVPFRPCATVFVALITRSGNLVEWPVPVRFCSDLELREVLLSHISAAKFFGNPQVSAIANFGAGFGDTVVALNRAIAASLTRNLYVERFGQKPQPPKASIVVCLYGRAEFLFLQNALFSGLPGFGDYEFIYVLNSPELAETLLREASAASRIYGTRITVVILPGNVGFGAANNAAVTVALTRRILVVNPDVFPRDPNWAQKHAELLSARPAEETRLFGVPLYYDDGSLMHGGMFFEIDTEILLVKERQRPVPLVRVEHYGKGAPVSVARFTRSRPVPAVTGAFISCDRDWFERLGGFTEDYVFGHYEDADLCLKSLERGSVPWLHDLRLWHLEGKGSTRRFVHEGGSLINRWLFSARWADLIGESLLGQHPSHALLTQDVSQDILSKDAQLLRAREADRAADAVDPTSVPVPVPAPDVTTARATPKTKAKAKPGYFGMPAAAGVRGAAGRSGRVRAAAG